MGLPNGGILATTAGVINYTYTGVRGRITYYVPTNTSVVDASSSGLSGEIVYNGVNEIHSISVPITKLTANESTIIQAYSNSLLTVIEAESSVTLVATNCALTAKSIGDILYAAYADNRANVNFNFTGGTNANVDAINVYLDYVYNITFTGDIDTVLTANGGTIQLNP